MPLFVPLDVGYFDDPKIRQVGAYAELLYVRALAFVKRSGTDGVLVRASFDAVSFSIDKRFMRASRLVSAGLWEETGDGWFICGWFNHNARTTEVSAARRDAGLKGNHRRWHLGPGGTPSADCKFCIANAIG